MIKLYFTTPKNSVISIISRLLFCLITVLIFISRPVLAEESQEQSDKRDLRMGQRLFMGLVDFKSGRFDCSSCHYLGATEEINWNPSAYDLAIAWLEEGGTDIYQVMNNPVSERLEEEHYGMTITSEEERLLQVFLKHVAEVGPGVLKPYPINTFTFWIMGILMALAVIDLLFTKRVRYRFIHVAILIIGIGVHTAFARIESIRVGRSQGYAPDQPIKFSHKIHAGENQIDCRYCHFVADYSLSGGIPSNSICLNCHNVIKNGTNSGAFEINKIHRAAKTGEPVRWVRIHKLPDHTFFSHAQHTNVAGIECQTCHGPVEEMHIVKQVEDLSMGWCINCHRDTKIQFFDNEYYTTFNELYDKLKTGAIDSVTASEVGGINCMKCHY